VQYSAQACDSGLRQNDVLNMKTSEQGLALIRRFEGFSPKPYRCPAGYLTIGYGHMVKEHEHYDNGISEQEAALLLKEDAGIAERAIMRLISAPLTQPQFDALVSFTFNLGAGALQRSTLRRKLNRFEYDEIPQELSKWIWAGGQRLAGLIYRRKAEAEMFKLK